MSNTRPDAATEKVIEALTDDAVGARYPDNAHFISAEDGQHPAMVAEALSHGDPAVLVYPDGRELMLTPQPRRGLAGLLLAASYALVRGRGRGGAGTWIPPGTRIEARDSGGVPLAV